MPHQLGASNWARISPYIITALAEARLGPRDALGVRHPPRFARLLLLKDVAGLYAKLFTIKVRTGGELLTGGSFM